MSHQTMTIPYLSKKCKFLRVFYVNKMCYLSARAPELSRLALLVIKYQNADFQISKYSKTSSMYKPINLLENLPTSPIVTHNYFFVTSTYFVQYWPPKTCSSDGWCSRRGTFCGSSC